MWFGDGGRISPFGAWRSGPEPIPTTGPAAPRASTSERPRPNSLAQRGSFRAGPGLTRSTCLPARHLLRDCGQATMPSASGRRIRGSGMPNHAEQAKRHDTAANTEPIVVVPQQVRTEVFALSHQGHVRDANEDSFAVFRMGRFMERISSSVPESDLPSRFEESGHLMIVADGLG